jgi:hypothetical protein
MEVELYKVITIVLAGVAHFWVNMRMLMAMQEFKTVPGIGETLFIFLFGWIVGVLGWFLQDVLGL